MHPMFLAVLVPVLLVVAVVLVRRRHVGHLLVIVAGGLVGCSPFLVWNARSGWPSLDDAPAASESYLDRVWIMVSDLVPRAIGLRASTMEWVHGRALGATFLLAVVGLAVVGVALGMRNDRRISRVLLPVTLVAALPLMALFPSLTFVIDGRYGMIVLPLIAMAVAQTASSNVSPRTAPIRWLVVLVVWVGVLVAPQVDVLREEADRSPNDEIRQVVAVLRDADVEFVSGSYWRVHTVDFLSDGDIVGSPSAPQIVRFPDFAAEIEQAPDTDVAFVFQTSDDDPAVLRLPVESYRRDVIGGTVLYVPISPTTSEG